MTVGEAIELLKQENPQSELKIMIQHKEFFEDFPVNAVESEHPKLVFVVFIQTPF